MHAPQITFLLFVVFGLAIVLSEAARNDKPSKLVIYIIRWAIVIAILIWGNFFSN